MGQNFSLPHKIGLKRSLLRGSWKQTLFLMFMINLIWQNFEKSAENSAWWISFRLNMLITISGTKFRQKLDNSENDLGSWRSFCLKKTSCSIICFLICCSIKYFVDILTRRYYNSSVNLKYIMVVCSFTRDALKMLGRPILNKDSYDVLTNNVKSLLCEHCKRPLS